MTGDPQVTFRMPQEDLDRLDEYCKDGLFKILRSVVIREIVIDTIPELRENAGLDPHGRSSPEKSADS